MLDKCPSCGEERQGSRWHICPEARKIIKAGGGLVSVLQADVLTCLSNDINTFDRIRVRLGYNEERGAKSWRRVDSALQKLRRSGMIRFNKAKRVWETVN